MQSASPVPQPERAQILDVLRGWSLLGICVANTSVFSGYIFTAPEDKKSIATYGMDRWLQFLETAAIQGKFYSIFSLLFGIGFSIILLRNQQKKGGGVWLFYKRLVVLALFGLIHAFLLWDGDILLLYALLGTLLPLFRNWSNKALLLAAAVLILSPIFIDIGRMVLGWNPDGFIMQIANKQDQLSGINGDLKYIMHQGAGYDEILRWNYVSFYYRWAFLISTNRLPKVLGMFLLGLYAGRHFLYCRLQENKNLLVQVQRWGFIIGVPSSIAMAYFASDGKDLYNSTLGIADTITYAFGVVPLSLAYVATICLYFLKEKWRSKMLLLAPAGRMPLTNYLMQSVFGVLVYYNIGLGLGWTTGPTAYFIIALLVFSVQVVYSTWWFRYFQFGPAEWLWRRAVYNSALPISKPVHPSPLAANGK